MTPRNRVAALSLIAVSALVLAASPSIGAAARGDAAAGQRIFAQCAACHKIDTTGRSGVGPNLNKVVGRRAGTLPGFRFSPAMTASGRVWTEANLDAYLAAPMATIPGSRMPYAGLRNPADRANVIAYIKSASK